MKLALVLPLALAAFIGVARAEEADDIREASKAEAETFNARMYAGTPGKTAYACFVRRYDAEHLARHPKQKVAAMKLLVSAEIRQRGQAAPQFLPARLPLSPPQRRFRLQSAPVTTLCSPRTAARFASAAASIARAAASALRSRRTTNRPSCGSRASGSGCTTSRTTRPSDRWSPASDDGIFRLERTDNSECAALVTDRKELAALRHK